MYWFGFFCTFQMKTVHVHEETQSKYINPSKSYMKTIAANQTDKILRVLFAILKT